MRVRVAAFRNVSPIGELSCLKFSLIIYPAMPPFIKVCSHLAELWQNAFSINAIVDVRRRLRHEMIFYISETAKASNFKI